MKKNLQSPDHQGVAGAQGLDSPFLAQLRGQMKALLYTVYNVEIQFQLGFLDSFPILIP